MVRSDWLQSRRICTTHTQGRFIKATDKKGDYRELSSLGMAEIQTQLHRTLNSEPITETTKPRRLDTKRNELNNAFVTLAKRE